MFRCFSRRRSGSAVDQVAQRRRRRFRPRPPRDERGGRGRRGLRRRRVRRRDGRAALSAAALGPAGRHHLLQGRPARRRDRFASHLFNRVLPSFFFNFFNEIKPMLRFGRTFAAAAVGQPARRGERGGRRRPLHVHGVQPHHGRGARQPARPQTGRQAGAQPTAAARLPLAARGTLHRSDRYGTRLVLQL